MEADGCMHACIDRSMDDDGTQSTWPGLFCSVLVQVAARFYLLTRRRSRQDVHVYAAGGGGFWVQ